MQNNEDGRKRKLYSSPDSVHSPPKRRVGDQYPGSKSLQDNSSAKETASAATPPLTTPTLRQHKANELLQTEKNYVQILDVILKAYKGPLEKGSSIPAQDIKTIFGPLSGILEVHKKIMNELEALLVPWREENCIGQMICKHADELRKVYPPFLSYFNKTLETVKSSTVLQEPEYKRQNLADLLARPMQRLPSMNLLLSDLLKHTNKENPDHVALGYAVKSLTDVLNQINEDRRKVEGHMQMFEIFEFIDGCPVVVVSAQRAYVTKADTSELSDTMCGKGKAVTIFLFSDGLEVTERRGEGKGYQHVKFMPLLDVKQVVDIKDDNDCQNSFGIRYFCPQEREEKYMKFKFEGDDKHEWLQKLTNAAGKEPQSFLTTVEPEDLTPTRDIPDGEIKRIRKTARRKLRLPRRK